MNYKVTKSLPPTGVGVVSDEKIETRSYLKGRTLRRVVFHRQQDDKELVFITNDLKRSALAIADLYKQRWQIELFFKWIKQNLKIKQFYGTSENAVKLQVLMAMISYVLLRLIQQTGRPFNGAEFLASLNDGREVYYAGERVENVTAHPAFKNAAASVAAMYDALHAEETKDKLCWATDTGNGGYTHKFFRYARSPQELLEQRDAIAEWARMSYGWMGRTADYKAAFGDVLGANPEFYGDFADNARTWYQRIQENCLYLNHAIVKSISVMWVPNWARWSPGATCSGLSPIICAARFQYKNDQRIDGGNHSTLLGKVLGKVVAFDDIGYAPLLYLTPLFLLPGDSHHQTATG
ncbi:4-hydroxyphenylacetate 3-hydroxylase N-terminal domain-containing protein [Candidatus Thalassolituus haligoni]|uniref:4-hydroxyphenylacetate 3-hydroxylase N-terminal domain-containing protein n=1 Tax=Candidatus Thalassolituus haligoni TaxID=3100113 RepID=UPI0035162BA2